MGISQRNWTISLNLFLLLFFFYIFQSMNTMQFVGDEESLVSESPEPEDEFVQMDES